MTEEHSPAQLIAHLQYADWQIIAQIRRYGEAVQAPLLAAMLTGSSGLRWSAAEILRDIGTADAVEPLLTLGAIEPDRPTRAHLLLALQAIYARETDLQGRILTAMEHGTSGVRQIGALVLRAIGDAQAVPVLLHVLDQEHDAEVQDNLLLTLGTIGDARAVEPVLLFLGHPNAVLRIRAAGALGHLGDRSAVEPLLEALAQPDNQFVRRTIVCALGALRDARAIPALLAELNNPTTRAIAVRAIGQLGAAEAVPALLEILTQAPLWPDRAEAARTLAAFPQPEVQLALRVACEDQEERVRDIATKSLAQVMRAKISGESSGGVRDKIA